MAFNLFGKKKEEPKFKPAAEAEEKKTAHAAVQIGGAVLKRFHVSEKASRGLGYNQYTFVVAGTATKTDVKHAVQRAYKVTVTDVSMVRLPSKKRTVGRYKGIKPGTVKAIVSVKEGQTIAQATA